MLVLMIGGGVNWGGKNVVVICVDSGDVFLLMSVIGILCSVLGCVVVVM